MAIGTNNTGFSSLAEVLSEKGLDRLGSAVEILINEASISNYSVYIHPCYRVEEFEYDIPKLINKNTLRNNEESLLDNCVVLFFKNLNKEGIGTLRMSNDLISQLPRKISLPTHTDINLINFCNEGAAICQS